jgi:hypothetical protein
MQWELPTIEGRPAELPVNQSEVIFIWSANLPSLAAFSGESASQISLSNLWTTRQGKTESSQQP